MRRLLVVSQVALGTILLVGAGLLMRSFVALTQVDPGFRAERVLTFRLSLPRGRYRSLAASHEFASPAPCPTFDTFLGAHRWQLPRSSTA